MPYNNGTSTMNAGALAAIIIISSLISLAAIIFTAVIYWRIASKAGYSGAMGLLMFVPIANIVVLCIFAFGEWPIYRELNYLRQQAARGQQYPPSPQYQQYGQPQQGQPQPPQYPQR